MVCPNCVSPRIISSDQERMECFSCGKTNKVDKLKVYHETEEHSEARVVLGQLNAGDDKEDFIETVEENVERFQSTSQSSPSSQKEKIQASLDADGVSTRQEIIEYAQTEYSLQPETSKKLLRKLETVGKIIVRKDGTVQKV